MSKPIPERADLRQLRTQAKERLQTLLSDPAAPKAKLADAQREIAREYDFPSWPALVLHLQTRLLTRALKRAIECGDADRLERLLQTKPAARRLLNEPLFDFDSPSLTAASRHANADRLLPVLVRYGADPNGRSKWWAGGFSALDFADAKTAESLLSLGARFDVWSAAAHGRDDVLRELLDGDPTMVDAPGGDGGRPLHFASTVDVIDLLVSRGADLELRDADHESTPIQYHVNRPDLLRALLDHGAKPDIFTAVALDDAELARSILIASPEMIGAQVGQAPFKTVTSDGGHIYAYQLGSAKTPMHFAAERENRAVLAELLSHARPAQRFVAAAWAEDRATVRALLREHPELGRELGPDARAIADAAGAGRLEAVRILLEAGVDPATPGRDSGSALHQACWFGHLDVARLLIGRVPSDLLDGVHGSPPLGWAAHGAQWCRNPNGDYVGLVEALIAAGADPNAPANRNGATMLEQAGDREDVKAILRQCGAN